MIWAIFRCNMTKSKMIEKQIKALQSMKGLTVEAGWFDSTRYPSETGGEGILVSEVARLNEFGHIAVLNFGQGPVRVEVPPRPFMRYAYELFVSERSEIENKIAKKIFSGKIDARQALGQIGLAMEAKIVESIKNGPWQPNARYTVRVKGFDKPLIHTSLMWQSVSSQVIK